MKKTLTLLSTAAVLGLSVVVAPAASASGDCVVIRSSSSLAVRCYQSAPGTEFRLVTDCNDGRRWSRWETQGHWIEVNCQNPHLVDIQYR